MRKSTNDKRSLIPSIRFDDSAITAIVSLILVITIVSFSISSILFWGIPYINENRVRAEKQASIDNFKVFNGLVNDLIRSGGPGSNITANFNNNIAEGSMEIDSVGDRLIITYSFSEDYIFNVTGLDDNDQWFSIYLEEDSNQELNSVRVYWLNDTCFISGTRVLMGNGSYKCIEDVMVGDFVRSYDENVGCVVSCRVTNVFHHSPEGMGGFYLVLNDGLGVTPNHRFFSSGSWVPIGSLGVGDSLFTSDLDSGYSVFSKRCVFRSVPVFDLSVEGCHNFFVGVEDGVDVLVHNVPEPPNQTITPSPENITIHTPTPGENYTGYPYNISISYIHLNNAINPTSGDTNYTFLRFNWSFYANRIFLSDWRNFSDSYTIADTETRGKFINDVINISMPEPVWFLDPGLYRLTVQVKVVNNSGSNVSNWSKPIYFDVDPGVIIPMDAIDVFTTIFDKPSDVIDNVTGGETEICIFDVKIPSSKPELTGAVRIDLYNSTHSTGDGPGNFTRNGTFPVGRIWLFDMGVINYILPYYDGTYKIVMENGGTVLLSPDGEARFLDHLSFYESSNSISMRVISIKRFEDESYLARGAGECVFRFKNAHSYGREFGDKLVYNFTIKMFGSNADVWLEYFERRFKFVRIDENTIEYDSVDGKKLILVSSILKANVERLLS